MPKFDILNLEFCFMGKKIKYSVLIIGLLSQMIYGQSQHEMNKKVVEEYQSINAELLHISDLILNKYKNQPDFLNQFNTLQSKWKDLVNLQIALMYPKNSLGSSQSLCETLYLIALTKQQINHLSVFLEPYKEGEICTNTYN